MLAQTSVPLAAATAAVNATGAAIVKATVCKVSCALAAAHGSGKGQGVYGPLTYIWRGAGSVRYP